jgi:hypothetical protein
VDKLDPKSTKFIEFGVENFHESNCRFVMQSRNWKGFVIDSSKERIAELAKRQYYWMHHLVSTAAFVTSENVNHLIEASGFSGQIGILSIDIDGNDYWVWDAINVRQPDIVIVEYNSFLGDRYAVTIPYQPVRRSSQRAVLRRIIACSATSRGDEGLHPGRLQFCRDECLFRPKRPCVAGLGYDRGSLCASHADAS